MKQLLVMSVRFVYSLVPFRCGERPLTVTNGQTCSLARRISEPERRRKEKKPYLASNFPLHLARSLLLDIRISYFTPRIMSDTDSLGGARIMT